MTEQPNSGRSDTPHKPTEEDEEGGRGGAKRRGGRGGLGGLRAVCVGGLFVSQIFSTLLSGIFFAS